MSTSIRLRLCDSDALAHAQSTVKEFHYLRAPVDARCSPVAYEVILDEIERDYQSRIGVLIFGRPEATRCYSGALTYGSLADVQSGRATFDRWEVLNLARVWLHPRVQSGGDLYRPELLPGYIDRRGVWRSTLASAVVRLALGSIGYDYLSKRPPCFPDEPYELRAVLSYCDTSKHKGTLYRAAGFQLARTNERGIETYVTTDVAPLTSYQHDMVRKASDRSPRAQRLRGQRMQGALL